VNTLPGNTLLCTVTARQNEGGLNRAECLVGRRYFKCLLGWPRRRNYLIKIHPRKVGNERKWLRIVSDGRHC
jgi:hypothetical protein